MRVTVLELSARWDALDAALSEVRTLLQRGDQTELALLPEASLTGYLSPGLATDLTRFAEPLDGRTCLLLSDLARECQTHLVGPLIEREGRHVYNALVGFRPDGERFLHYRKRHPWYPEQWATPGEAPLPVVTVSGWQVTAAICFDVHFLAAEASDALRAADLLLFPSAWVEELDSRPTLLPELARQFEVAILNANWGPGDVRLPGQGGSMIVDASGAVVSRAKRGVRSSRRIDAVLTR